MPEAIGYNKDKLTDGETAFNRGLSLASVIDQMNIALTDPNAGRDGSDVQLHKWHAEQKQREHDATGFLLGYFNGALQAIRRIDNQMRLPQ
jgi:hypothetical protein